MYLVPTNGGGSGEGEGRRYSASELPTTSEFMGLEARTACLLSLRTAGEWMWFMEQ
ncbi:MAG: hypothetical protein LCI00_28290 [Chloroflexi bacterium]|nr:hypothetical protein [Chloroflexota bacterium]